MAGWVVGVLVEIDGEVARRFFAVGEADRAKAEWRAADLAQAVGPVASSPHGGHEPVETVGPVTAETVARLGLRPREVKALGARWPRRWLSAPTPVEED